jgi:hypothetical protein
MIDPAKHFWGHVGINAVLALVIMTLLSPLCLYPFSIAGDYPNHYAAFSMALKKLQGGSPFHFYQVEWHLLPHLAMGALALPVAFGMDLPFAFHAFLLASAAMPIIGALVVHRQIHGVTSWSFLLSSAMVYNICLYYGFLDFNFSLGLAFLLYALLLRQTGEATAFGYILLSLGTAVLFLAHLLGFLIFGLLLLCQRIQLCSRAAGARSKLGTFIPPIVWLSPAAILVLCWIKNPVRGLPQDALHSGLPNLVILMRTFLGPFYFNDPHPAIFLVPLFLVLVPYAILIRLLQASRDHLVSVGTLLLATLIFTQRVGGVEIDFRLALATFLMVVAVVKLGNIDNTLKKIVAIASFLFLACGLSLQWPAAWQNLRTTDHEVKSIRKALQGLPLRSRLLVANSADSRQLLHTGAFIALDRDGFFPLMFQVDQPIRARKEFAAINMPGVEMYGDRLLAGAGKPPVGPEDDSWFNLNGDQGWPLRFDFLIWFSASEGPMNDFPFLEKINSGDHFFLYRIEREKALETRHYANEIQL